jgi:hypothetical protein
MKPEAQILFLLLAGVYGTLTIVMKFFEMINERRDILLGIKERQVPLSREAKVLLWSDWILLWLGCLLFLGCITVYFGTLPSLGDKKEESFKFISMICYICSVISAYGFLAQAGGGTVDIRAMRRSIRETQSPETAKAPSPARQVRTLRGKG